MFDNNLNTTSVSFFIADFNILNCKFDSFTFKLLYPFIQVKIKLLTSNCTYKPFTVPCEKSKTISFAFLIIKNIVVFPVLSKFVVILIC